MPPDLLDEAGRQFTFVAADGVQRLPSKLAVGTMTAEFDEVRKLSSFNRDQVQFFLRKI